MKSKTPSTANLDEIDGAERARLELAVLRRIKDRPAPRRSLQNRLYEQHKISYALSSALIGSLAARLCINNNRQGGNFVVTTIGREVLDRADREASNAPARTEWRPVRVAPARIGADDYKRVPSLFGPPAAVFSAHRRVV